MSIDDGTNPDWVPDACALPTADRPLRLAEFDDLFGAHLTSAEAVAATRARLALTGGDELADEVRALCARETSCCSFFTFTITPTANGVDLDIEVPPPYREVLSGLVRRAEAAAA